MLRLGYTSCYTSLGDTFSLTNQISCDRRAVLFLSFRLQPHSSERASVRIITKIHTSTMAEALAIIGLVSNIISFIDFGIKFASGARSVRDSLHGTTAEIRELELIVEDVERYHEQVKKQKIAGQKLSVHEQRILNMVKQCQEIAKELHKAIDRLHVRQGRSKTLESSRVLFQSFWKQRDIVAMRKRLEDLDQRIRLNVEYIVRRYSVKISTPCAKQKYGSMHANSSK
jgi:hypothetical protein